jgi:hypothetical protein
MDSYTLGKRVAKVSLDGVSWCELPITAFDVPVAHKIAIPSIEADMSRDTEVTLTVEAGQVIDAIEALTATLQGLGLVAAYPALSPERLTDAGESSMTKNMIIAQWVIGYQRVRDGIATVAEKTWDDLSQSYTIEYPNGMRLVQDTRPPIDIPQDQFDNDAARLLATAYNESQAIIEELAYCITTMPWLDWIAVPPLPLEEHAKVTDAVRRLQIAMRLADSFPYSAHDIVPLANIAEDEALIRSVLGDYVGQKDGLARAREVLLAMRADNGD